MRIKRKKAGIKKSFSKIYDKIVKYIFTFFVEFCIIYEIKKAIRGY